MDKRPKSEYRIYIEDVSGRKIGTFSSIDYCIREIGFDGDTPMYRVAPSSEDYVSTLGAPKAFTIQAYRQITRKHIERNIQRLQEKLEALDKEPILESQIFKKEEYTSPEREAILKMEKLFFEVNDFKPPNDDDEGSVKLRE